MKILIADDKSFKDKSEIYVKALKEFCPNETANSMLNTIKRDCFFCFVFNDNEEVVTWARVAKPYNRKTIYCIRQIETKEQHQGNGYASFCYSAIEDYVSKLENAKKLISFVDNENISSINFHKKMGYTVNKTASKYLQNLYGWNSAIMFEKNTLNKKQEFSI